MLCFVRFCATGVPIAVRGACLEAMLRALDRLLNARCMPRTHPLKVTAVSTLDAVVHCSLCDIVRMDNLDAEHRQRIWTQLADMLHRFLKPKKRRRSRLNRPCFVVMLVVFQ